MAADRHSEVLKQIAPEGRMRVGLNLANPMLAHGPADAPGGIAVDLSRELGERLGVPVVFCPFEAAGKVVDALKSGACDIAYMAVDPGRASDFLFSPAYMWIEAVFAVRAESSFRSPAELDREGVRIASADGAAYTQHLARGLKRAELALSKDPVEDFLAGKADAVAGIRRAIAKMSGSNGGVRVVPEAFMKIPQAIAIARGRDEAAEYFGSFLTDLAASGFVKDSLARHGLADAVVPAQTS